jgi:Family of unknown function (DUF6011)
MTLPLPSTEPAPTVRCRSIRPSGRRCNLVLRDAASIARGVGPECARREGLQPPRRPRLASLCSEAADDTTLLDLINEGAQL